MGANCKYALELHQSTHSLTLGRKRKITRARSRIVFSPDLTLEYERIMLNFQRLHIEYSRVGDKQEVMAMEEAM